MYGDPTFNNIFGSFVVYIFLCDIWLEDVIKLVGFSLQKKFKNMLYIQYSTLISIGHCSLSFLDKTVKELS